MDESITWLTLHNLLLLFGLQYGKKRTKSGRMKKSRILTIKYYNKRSPGRIDLSKV